MFAPFVGSVRCGLVEFGRKFMGAGAPPRGDARGITITRPSLEAQVDTARCTGRDRSSYGHTIKSASPGLMSFTKTGVDFNRR